MELQTDLAALREKYQKIMAKFTYQGKEPEAKERLRHLFHNQMTSVSSLAPEPQDWNAWTEACVQKKDWLGLCRVINQRNKNAMMPVIYGGYTYEKNVHCVLESFLCGNVQAMERILPCRRSCADRPVVSGCVYTGVGCPRCRAVSGGEKAQPVAESDGFFPAGSGKRQHGQGQ